MNGAAAFALRSDARAAPVNRASIGTSQWGAYTDRVRVIVVESGNTRAGRWVDRSRERGTAWFGGFRLGARS